MNIHFQNEILFKKLRKNSLLEIEFGSSLYNLGNKKSDKDIMCFYVKSQDMEDSFLWEHHQLQYKDQENNIDYIFTDIHNFLRNLISGDSTVNFELIHTIDFKNSCFSFLYDNKNKFYSYNIIKSYLGLSKRDLKQYRKGEYNNQKKLSHAQRGLFSALKVKNNEYSNKFSSLETNLLKKLKTNKFSLSKRSSLANEMEKNIQLLRDELNKDLEDQKIYNYLEINFMKDLDKWLKSLVKDDIYQKNKLSKFDLDLFYEALENGINY